MDTPRASLDGACGLYRTTPYVAGAQASRGPVTTHEFTDRTTKGSPPDYLITDDDLNLGPLALECQRCYAEGPYPLTYQGES
jgi:hypothetical protein